MRTSVALAALALTAGIFMIAMAEESRPLDLRYHFSLEANELVLANLAGEIRVEGHDGPNFEIDGTVLGKDAAPGRLRAEIDDKGESARFAVQYPVERERKFIYPPMGRGSSTRLTLPLDRNEDNWLGWILPGGDRHRVEIKGSGGGIEIWSDITVKVPRGRSAVVHLGAGKIGARSTAADLLLDTHNGSVSADDIEGDLSIDTGSGDVRAISVSGEISIDTGSGDVLISSCSGPSILVDTGSGDVEAKDIECKRLRIDTGSGDVSALSFRTDEATVDTGSGGVDISFDRMGQGPYRIDTGSGDVDFTLPEKASVDLVAETGTGGISCDVSNARIRRDGRDELRMITGGGETRVMLDTGSGSIRISEQRR